MRTMVLLATLLLAGCQTYLGPVRRNAVPPVCLDNPCLPIAEQQARARARLPFPDQTNDLAPRTYAEIPNSSGR